jgi:hypothetical protein
MFYYSAKVPIHSHLFFGTPAEVIISSNVAFIILARRRNCTYSKYLDDVMPNG